MIHFYAFTAHRPDFIGLQVQCLRKYLQEDFTYTIFNNCLYDCQQNYAPIKAECEKWGVRMLEIRKDDELTARCNATEKSCAVFNRAGSWSNNNCAGNYAACYAWEKYIVSDGGNICLMHPDVFFNVPIRLSDYLKESPLAFIPQGRAGLDGAYMHDALVLADMWRLPDPTKIFWWGSLVNGIATDIGGQTYFYLKSHPDLKVTHVQPWYHEDDPSVDFHPAEYEIFAIDNKPIALHYFRGSTCPHRQPDFHRLKTEWLKKQLHLEDQL